MAKVPGVPTLEPVNKPQESPGEAGKPGQAVANLGEVGQGIALEGMDFQMYLKRAQQHVDSLAAQNDLAKVYADTQNKLAHTQNSRDVEGVITDANKTLNDVSSQWSKSPAAIQIQQSADALRPDLSRIGTVKQVDLMGKEFKVTINQQAEVLAGSYASDRGAGGSGDMALGAFATAVHGGVETGLVGDVEAQDMVRQFKQAGQELQIRNAITNANPEVNTKIYEDIDKHRDMFPDVTQEKLDTLKGQALSAFEAHTKQKDWAEGQMALHTLPAKINQFTNPATGKFDEAAALTDNADRFAKGELTDTQQKVMAQGIVSHQAQLSVGLKQEAGKRLDGIEKKLSAHDFQGASAGLEANKPWFENNGFSDDYRAALRYTSAKRTEVRAEVASERAENRYEHEYARQVATENSQDTLAEATRVINGGGMLTYADIYGKSGTGKGTLKTTDANTVYALMQRAQKEPDFAGAMKYIGDNFPTEGSDAEKKAHPDRFTPDAIASQNQKYAKTLEVFQQEVNAHPEKSKMEIAHELVKSAGEEQIKAHADAMFGTTPTPSLGKRIGDFLFGGASKSLEKAVTDTPTKTATIVQHSSSTGKDRYSTDGGKTWQPGKPQQ